MHCIIGHPSSILLYLCISQTYLSPVIIAHLSSILLFLFIAQTLLSFLAVIDGHPSSILFMHWTDLALTLNSDYWASELYSAHLCIPQTLPSLLRLISSHLSSTLLSLFCSFYALHRPCSHSQQSLLHMQAQLCSFHTLQRPCSHGQQSLLCI